MQFYTDFNDHNLKTNEINEIEKLEKFNLATAIVQFRRCQASPQAALNLRLLSFKSKSDRQLNPLSYCPPKTTLPKSAQHCVSLASLIFYLLLFYFHLHHMSVHSLTPCCTV